MKKKLQTSEWCFNSWLIIDSLKTQSFHIFLSDCKGNLPTSSKSNIYPEIELSISVRLIAYTVKGQSRSDSLLLSPYHWAKLFRGVVAIVAVPMRFAVICWIVLEAFVGQIHVFPLGSWMTIQVLGLSRISFWKSYREAVRLEKVQVSHHHNF